MGFRGLKIKINHQFRAFRYGLFNARRIFKFMKSTEKEGPSEKSATSDVPTITVFEAEKMLTAGNFVILDVRGTSDYEKVHIWNSIHIEFTEILENLE